MRRTAGQIQDEANHWAARMDGADWNIELEAELSTWLDTDRRHRGALLRAQAAWAMLDLDLAAAPRLSSRNPLRMDRRWMIGGGAAAAVVASIGAGVIWTGRIVKYETATGEIRRLPLKDGSTAVINTGSRVDVKFEPNVRHLVVSRGQAWFDVAKDPNRPFVVEAGKIRVQAMGTAFSVFRREGGADIVVSEGIVKVWSEEAPTASVEISAGSGAFVANDAAVRFHDDPVDQSLAWRSGEIELSATALGQAISEFNRYNQRRLILDDLSLSDRQFDGVFRANDPVGFATVVGSTLRVPVDLSDPNVIRIGHASEK